MNTKNSRFPFAHTFSIVARDKKSGAFGVAVQSHWFSVGSLVPWAEAGVGAVATQSMVDVNYGPLGLQLMKSGFSAEEALEELLKKDSGRELRQVAMLDSNGNTAVHTGERCIADAGHECGDGFTVQANMMINDRIWPAMAEAYRKKHSFPFEDRLVSVLEAAQEAGGDIRGKQSAAILIVKGETSGQPWNDRLIDLRVEDHPEPIRELKRLLNVHKAYQYMNQGDELLGKGDLQASFIAYQNAAGLAPEISELPFWQAVTMAETGNLEQALPLFQKVFHEDPNWAELLRRLPAAGLFSVKESILLKILNQI